MPNYNRAMYIIAIAWLYVIILMAATESNLTAGILTLVLYGVAPLALFLWLFGTPYRRRQSARKVVDEAVSQHNAGNPGADE